MNLIPKFGANFYLWTSSIFQVYLPRVVPHNILVKASLPASEYFFSLNKSFRFDLLTTTSLSLQRSTSHGKHY
jgi:hypothetical protein